MVFHDAQALYSQVRSTATALLNGALKAIHDARMKKTDTNASYVQAETEDGGTASFPPSVTSLALFNTLEFKREEVVQCSAAALPASAVLTQDVNNGQVLVVAAAPPSSFSPLHTLKFVGGVAARVEDDGAFVLENAYISAKVDSAGALVSLVHRWVCGRVRSKLRGA